MPIYINLNTAVLLITMQIYCYFRYMPSLFSKTFFFINESAPLQEYFFLFHLFPSRL